MQIITKNKKGCGFSFYMRFDFTCCSEYNKIPKQALHDAKYSIRLKKQKIGEEFVSL